MLLSHSYHNSERFRAQAFNDFTIFGLQALASLSAGTILYRYNWAILNWINVPVLVVLLVLLLSYRKRLQVRPELPIA